MEDRLIELAKNASDNAYAKYSDYQVGAAAVDEQGRIFTGCNIENASYGATMCAERVAIFNAVSNGSKEIKKIAISAKKSMPYPCGMCRQVMSEFAKEDMEIILEYKGNVKHYTLGELLPHSFDL